MNRWKWQSQSQQLKIQNNSIPCLVTSKFPWPVLKVSCRDQRPLSDGIQHQQLQSRALRAWWGNQSSHDTQWLDQLLPLRREICGQSYRSVRSAFINKAKMNQTEEQSFKEQGRKENISMAVTTNLWHVHILIYLFLTVFSSASNPTGTLRTRKL